MTSCGNRENLRPRLQLCDRNVKLNDGETALLSSFGVKNKKTLIPNCRSVPTHIHTGERADRPGGSSVGRRSAT